MAIDDALHEALVSSQRLGMLGDRPVGDVVEHASAFVGALVSTNGTVVDLGSGGGVPGLVIARARPDLRVILVDRRVTRTDHLRRLVHRLGLSEQVEVWAVEARSLAATIVEPVDAVVARGFGPPIETMRHAVPLLRPAGLLVVSEPPVAPAGRWPDDVLRRLGVDPVEHADGRVACFRRV